MLTAPDPAPRRSNRRGMRLLVALLLLVLGIVGGMTGLLWWSDRPLRKAEADLQQGNPRQALTTLVEYLDSHPHSTRARQLRARALVALGRWPEAIRIYRRSGPEDVADIHAWAQALLHLQQWAEALPKLERVLETAPENADALHEITACRERLGLYDAALESARHLSRLPGFEARGSLLVGTIEQNLGNQRNAVGAWSRVLKWDPDASDLQVPANEFLLEYGQSLLEVGQPQKAREVLERSAKIRPIARCYELLGQAYSHLGEIRQATKAWSRAVALDSRNRRARQGLARDALRRRKADEAMRWLSPLLSSSDLNSATAYLAQRACVLSGDRAQAEVWQKRAAGLRKIERRNAAIEHLLKDAPQSFWAQVVRAYRFAEKKNWVQAANTISSLREGARQNRFVQDLSEAIRSRGPLPSLNRLPLKQF